MSSEQKSAFNQKMDAAAKAIKSSEDAATDQMDVAQARRGRPLSARCHASAAQGDAPIRTDFFLSVRGTGAAACARSQGGAGSGGAVAAEAGEDHQADGSGQGATSPLRTGRAAPPRPAARHAPAASSSRRAALFPPGQAPSPAPGPRPRRPAAAGEFISLTALLFLSGICWLACIGHRALQAEQKAVGPASPLLQKPMAPL